MKTQKEEWQHLLRDTEKLKSDIRKYNRRSEIKYVIAFVILLLAWAIALLT